MISESPLIESEASQLARAAVDVNLNTGPIAGPLNGAKLHLGAANIAITPDTTNAALVADEATFTGYAAQVLVWGAPLTAADNTVEVVSGTLTFTPTDAVVDNTVYYLWISNAGSTVWYFAGIIVGGPLPMAGPLNEMKVTVRYRPATKTLAVVLA